MKKKDKEEAVATRRRSKLSFDDLFRAAERRLRSYPSEETVRYEILGAVNRALKREEPDHNGNMKVMSKPANEREANIVRHYAERASKGMSYGRALELALRDIGPGRVHG